ncbi:MAG TPA: peptidylprolyl isomerase, partial [Cyanobacteria bacterium UBA12227]|nr:peptidylprolyl isomerase [Cyanobacteria bacterium UBA12227]
MKEILISLGVIVACGLLLLLVQLSPGSTIAMADELTQTQPTVTANPPINDKTLIAMNTGSESEQTTGNATVTTP